MRIHVGMRPIMNTLKIYEYMHVTDSLHHYDYVVGFAFVRYYDKRDAEDAMDAMDGAIFDGRELRVQMARYGRPSDPYRRGPRGGGRRRR